MNTDASSSIHIEFVEVARRRVTAKEGGSNARMGGALLGTNESVPATGGAEIETGSDAAGGRAG